MSFVHIILYFQNIEGEIAQTVFVLEIFLCFYFAYVFNVCRVLQMGKCVFPWCIVLPIRFDCEDAKIDNVTVAKVNDLYLSVICQFPA